MTQAQLDLLQWIADGSPDGVMGGDSHHVSAAALRRRDLVKTFGRGETWRAEITPAGREYLEQAKTPGAESPRQANVSVTQQLVDDVIAAGGALRVPRRNWGDVDGVDYENRALLAERYGKVPAGKRLEVASVDDELEIKLLDAPGNLGRAELVEISVPEKVARYHSTARRFRDDKTNHEVSRTQLQRAVRIVHTVATEAERRGWTAQRSTGADDESRQARGRSGAGGRFEINAGGHDFRLRLYEKGVHTRGPWEDQVEYYRDLALRWGSYGSRDVARGSYDADATGELNLELQVDRPWIFRGRQSRWGDRKSWTLEERLPHLFRELEERIAKADRVAEEERIAAEKAAEKARRAAEERERQWHLLMDQARQRLVETQRIGLLRAQAKAWKEADLLCRYCDAMDEAHGEHPESAEWIAWVRDFASRVDPLGEPPVMPDPPEETPEALQEHLPQGWSVYGPEYGRHHIPSYRRFD